jgi:hypothetical protein
MNIFDGANIFKIFVQWLIQHDIGNKASFLKVTSTLTLPWPKIAAVSKSLRAIVIQHAPQYAFYSIWKRDAGFVNAWKQALSSIWYPRDIYYNNYGCCKLSTISSFSKLASSLKNRFCNVCQSITDDVTGDIKIRWTTDEESDNEWGFIITIDPCALFGYIKCTYNVREIEYGGTWVVHLEERKQVDDTGYNLSDMEDYCLDIAEEWLKKNSNFY